MNILESHQSVAIFLHVSISQNICQTVLATGLQRDIPNVLKDLFKPRHHLPPPFFFFSAIAQFDHWIRHITFRWNCHFKNTCYAQPDLVYRTDPHFRSHHSVLNADCFPWSECSSYRSPLCDKSTILADDTIKNPALLCSL